MCAFYEFPMQQAEASERFGRGIGDFIRWLGRSLLLAMERSQHRRALLALSDHQLRDIGLTREQVLSHAPQPIQHAEAEARGQSPAESSHDLRAA